VDEPIDQLLNVASGAIGEPVAPTTVSATLDASGLAPLLTRRNGFYALEGAVHVFPTGQSSQTTLEVWNDPALWRSRYQDLDRDVVFFAEDIFGGQFGLRDNAVVSFDPETGALEPIAPSLDAWAELVLIDQSISGYPLAHSWQVANGALPSGQRLVPKQPFVLGGPFDSDNLYALPAIEGMLLRADLASQIRDLPDGTQIRYVIE
jgi:hypothetical protein